MTYLFDYSNFLENNKKIFHNYSNNIANTIINLKETKKFVNTLKEIRSISGDETLIYLQISADSSEKIIKTVKMVFDEVGGKFYIKTPNNIEGNMAKKRLIMENINLVTGNILEEKHKEFSKTTDCTILKVINSNSDIYEKIIKKLISSNLNYNNSFVSDWRKM